MTGVSIPKKIETSQIMAYLRSATREEHESVEKRVDIESCSDDPVYYRLILQRFLGFFQPVERALLELDGLADCLPDLTSRLRTGLLTYDLQVLGLSTQNVLDLPRCSQRPEIRSIGQAMGCLYVLEGSTLGGQMIVRRIYDRGLINRQACHFFFSHGRDIGRMWRDFSQAAERYATAHPEEMETITASAKETFRKLEAWLAINPT